VYTGAPLLKIGIQSGAVNNERGERAARPVCVPDQMDRDSLPRERVQIDP